MDISVSSVSITDRLHDRDQLFYRRDPGIPTRASSLTRRRLTRVNRTSIPVELHKSECLDGQRRSPYGNHFGEALRVDQLPPAGPRFSGASTTGSRRMARIHRDEHRPMFCSNVITAVGNSGCKPSAKTFRRSGEHLISGDFRNSLRTDVDGPQQFIFPKVHPLTNDCSSHYSIFTPLGGICRRLHQSLVQTNFLSEPTTSPTPGTRDHAASSLDLINSICYPNKISYDFFSRRKLRMDARCPRPHAFRT